MTSGVEVSDVIVEVSDVIVEVSDVRGSDVRGSDVRGSDVRVRRYINNRGKRVRISEVCGCEYPGYAK